MRGRVEGCPTRALIASEINHEIPYFYIKIINTAS
jgi:hypothetical protein